MKFLIVDDETLIRKSLVRALSRLNHFCFEAENGQEALTILQQETIDVVILDLIMPVKSGYDVIAESKSKAPIFIISAFSGPELSADYLKTDQRIQMFIKKPFDNLFTTIEVIIKQVEALKGNSL